MTIAMSANYATQLPQLPFIDADCVFLDPKVGTAKRDILRYLAESAVASGRASSSEAIVAAALERESQTPTGLDGGIAIPHCRHKDWNHPSLFFLRLDYPTEFTTPSGPADLIFFIGVGEQQGSVHIDILSALARGLRNKGFRAALRGAETAAEAAHIISEQISGAPQRQLRQTEPAEPQHRREAAVPRHNVEQTQMVAITACPTGIAHTYLAAEALTEAAAQRRDTRLSVETQGAADTALLTAETINRADVVIVSADVQITGLERFSHLPILQVPMSQALHHADEVIDQARSLAASGVHHSENRSVPSVKSQLRTALLSSVGYLLPIAVVGAFFYAAALAMAPESLRGYTTPADSGHFTTIFSHDHLGALAQALQVLRSTSPTLSINFAEVLSYLLGVAALLSIPVALATAIGFSLAGRSAIAPAFLGGMLSTLVELNWFGAVLSGIVAGVLIQRFQRIARSDKPLLPIVFNPIAATTGVGLVLALTMVSPLARVPGIVAEFFNGLNPAGAAILGVILGAMICADIGGPINKIAYVFALVSLGTMEPAAFAIMAAVMAAGMVPPLAAALAATVAPKLFSESERNQRSRSTLLGLFFISEGAMPYRNADREATSPAFIAGGALTAALSMYWAVSTPMPHGGILALFALTDIVSWLGAIALGTCAGALGIVAAKVLRQRHPAG